MNGVQENVSRQYEAFPYPARDPRDESHRLIGTWLDDLGLLNHHCFRGERRFEAGFRILVAGGGTGDGTIFLADQLKGSGARIVHLDVSEASIAIAAQRAKARGLGGIEWLHADLADLPGLGLGEFDYINCVGVLHHLESPEKGLDALLGCLAADGALGLMVYGQVGRTGVYQVQSLLSMLNRGVGSESARLANAKALLPALPSSNWFIRAEHLHPDHRTGGDAGIVDLLLHPRDRAFTVTELYEWIEDRAGLQITFSDVHRGRLPYSSHSVLSRADPSLLDCLDRLPMRAQQAVAELACGDIITHSFYATRLRNRSAPYGDATYVPFFVREQHAAKAEDIGALIDRQGDEAFTLTHAQSGLSAVLCASKPVREIFRFLDGATPFHRIFAQARTRLSSPDWPDQRLFDEFEPWFAALNLIDRLLLRR